MCPTLCDPMDCSPPGSTVHGILQARILEWVAISFSRGSSRPRDQTQVSHIAGSLFTDQVFRKDTWSPLIKNPPPTHSQGYSSHSRCISYFLRISRKLSWENIYRSKTLVFGEEGKDLCTVWISLGTEQSRFGRQWLICVCVRHSRVGRISPSF